MTPYLGDVIKKDDQDSMVDCFVEVEVEAEAMTYV